MSGEAKWWVIRRADRRVGRWVCKRRGHRWDYKRWLGAVRGCSRCGLVVAFDAWDNLNDSEKEAAGFAPYFTFTTPAPSGSEGKNQ